MSRLLLTHAILCAGAAAVSTAGPQVALTSGTFVGTTSVLNGTDRWLGIPFAQHPTGVLRFKAPVPIAQPSPDIQQAVVFGSACPQVPSNILGAPMAEDCLFLNVCVDYHRFPV